MSKGHPCSPPGTWQGLVQKPLRGQTIQHQAWLRQGFAVYSLCTFWGLSLSTLEMGIITPVLPMTSQPFNCPSG